jgi:hypothetical protein
MEDAVPQYEDYVKVDHVPCDVLHRQSSCCESMIERISNSWKSEDNKLHLQYNSDIKQLLDLEKQQHEEVVKKYKDLVHLRTEAHKEELMQNQTIRERQVINLLEKPWWSFLWLF